MYLRSNPVTTAVLFQHRVDSFFNVFLKSKATPVGFITDHVIKIEFQACGTPHAHYILWVKDAPEVDVDCDEEVSNFIDKYVSGQVPSETKENKELKNLLHYYKHTNIHQCTARRRVNVILVSLKHHHLGQLLLRIWHTVFLRTNTKMVKSS